ncbi:MAG: HlyD family efflux transporter periplasmic adaptor subunit [Mucilaginibacter sp.]|nr:HlyD family efflux transporter periplasmic adaptor subunit [Mucilaginibacter sp.]
MSKKKTDPNSPAPEDTRSLEESKRHKKLILYNTISLIVVVAATIWAAVTYFHLVGTIYTDDAQVESYINPINTRISGYIREIRFSEHQKVKKGDTLVLIDNREYQILVDQAAAVLLDARANKVAINTSVEVAQKGVDISFANIAEARARLVDAEANFKRYEKLLKEDVVTKFQYDEVKSDFDALRARYQALTQTGKRARFTSKETGQQVAVADAAVKKAEASLEYTKLNLAYTVITAPYEGVVGRKIIEEGQFVQPGQTLVSIVRGDEKWITANYAESQVSKLNIGQKVLIHVDAVQGKSYKGLVFSIADATGSRFSAIPTDNSTGNFVKVQQRLPVKIIFSKENSAQDISLLKAGMNAEVDLDK